MANVTVNKIDPAIAEAMYRDDRRAGWRLAGGGDLIAVEIWTDGHYGPAHEGDEELQPGAIITNIGSLRDLVGDRDLGDLDDDLGDLDESHLMVSTPCIYVNHALGEEVFSNFIVFETAWSGRNADLVEQVRAALADPWPTPVA